MLHRAGKVMTAIFVLSMILTVPVDAKVLIEEFKATQVFGQTYVLADVTADGEMELVIGSGQEVYILTKDKGYYDVQWKISGISPGVRALAVGDVDNDSWPDLLVGTGQAGAIRIFGWNGEKFVRKGETDYLWSPVTKILIIDIDGDGWKDILAVTESGSAQLLRWDGLRYEKSWEHKPSAGRIKFFQTADINGDDVEELVYALAEGKVVVAQWNGHELAPIWENYPWGTVSTVSLLDLDGDQRVEIIVTTEQQMLYCYGWTQHGIGLKRSFSDPSVKFSEAVGVDLDGDGKGELVTIDPEGIKVWKLGRDSLQLQAQATFIQGPQKLRLTPDGTKLILLDRTGALRTLRLVDESYFRCFLGDTEVKLGKPPIWVNDMPLLAAQDAAELLGLTVYWDAQAERLTAFGDGRYAVLQIGERSMDIVNTTVPLQIAPVVKDSECYVPVEFMRIFATNVFWDEASRTLRIMP